MSDIKKGVPQGSIMGPIIFNLFINDIFSVIRDGQLYNYADDNSVLVQAKQKDDVVKKLKDNAGIIVNWCSENQMAANPAKFQVMIGEEKSPSQIDLDEITSISSEPQVKLLGIYLDNFMNFNYHVTHLLQKASRQLNCLKRTAYPLKSDLRLLLYKSFVYSNFNYCPVVWHHCGQTNTKKLEKLQYRALKFVFNDYVSDYESLLERAQMPTLSVYRLRSFAIEVYKIHKNLGPSIMNKLISEREITYNLRSGRSYATQHNRTTKYGLHSFRHFGVKIWNNLPASFRSADDLVTFKKLIKTWYGIECKCAYCK